jgi:putative Mg2+ transporter-C (MgtC) family protein
VTVEILLISRLCVAALCSAILGFERELARKPAGLRTNMLIAVGSALFTYLSITFDSVHSDPSRIAAQIVTGVGFLGAGTILRGERDTITGLTSAATVWVVAALGMLAGAGQYRQAICGALLAWLILTVLGIWEGHLIARIAQYEIRLDAPIRDGILSSLRVTVHQVGLSLESFTADPVAEGRYQVTVRFTARPWSHRRVLQQIRRIEGIRDLNDRML